MNPIFIEVSAEVRYWEDAIVNGKNDDNGKLIPLRNGTFWRPIINLSDGKIQDWPKGATANIHYKVSDAGEYWLLNKNKERIAKWGGYYVPNQFLCHGDDGYGDYIILNVNDEGAIENWTIPEIIWSCNTLDDDDQYKWKKIKDEENSNLINKLQSENARLRAELAKFDQGNLLLREDGYPHLQVK